MDLIDIVQTFKEIVYLKARQLGITWFFTGYGLHRGQFNDNAKVLYMSQGEEEAWDMVAKSHFIWEHEPEWMKLPLLGASKSQITFKNNHSVIKALPSTERAGRGTDATLVVRDELAKHPYGKDNFTAISPAIDSGGQLIDLSTIDKFDTNNHFTERVQRALLGATRKDLPSGISVYTGGGSGAALVFAGWSLRPVRQEGMTLDDWFELRIKPKYTPVEIEQEYPNTIEDALRPSASRAFFDLESIAEMEFNICEPLQNVEIDTQNGLINIYKKPQIGRHYIIFTDPSDGIEDPFATVVIDSQTWEGVASASGWKPAKEAARIHDSLVRYYNNAYNSGEVNAAAGGTFIDTLRELETPNIAPRRSAEGKVVTGKMGWYTTNPLRDRALHDYKSAVHANLVTIHDRDAINEHRSFIQPEGDDKPRASGGAHDDWIMAWAGVWFLKKFFVPPDALKVKSGKYRY